MASSPPLGYEYKRFTFEPKRGESGIIVFCDEMMSNSVCKDQAPWLHLFQYDWSGDKLIVEWGIKRPTRAYTDSHELGLVVQVRDWYYITGPVADHDNDYKVVDLFTMLKYIDGKIGLKELDHNARSYERRQIHIRRMKGLEQELQSAQWSLTSSLATVDKVVELNRSMSETMELARRSLDIQILQAGAEVRWMRSLPRWLVPKGVRTLFEVYDNL